MVMHSILKQLSELPGRKLDLCLHELACLLREIEELTEKKHTIIPGNNNCLDLIRHVDLTEYCMMYCPHCRKIHHVTAEGCEGLVLFSCDNCNGIIIELFKIAG